MIFRLPILEGIARGEVTLAFRRWTRPSVRQGGTLKTGAGVLRIGTIRKLSVAEISETEARAAGYRSAAELTAELAQRSEGELYRIEVSYEGADPRIALREQVDLGPEGWAALDRKLRRLDGATPGQAWTAAVLRLIAAHPGVRAAELADKLGQERDRFKVNVRKLKNLGLTESLEVGYRISPRGQRVLALLDQVRGGGDSPGL